MIQRSDDGKFRRFPQQLERIAVHKESGEFMHFSMTMTTDNPDWAWKGTSEQFNNFRRENNWGHDFALKFSRGFPGVK